MLIKLQNKIPSKMKINSQQIGLPNSIRTIRDAIRFNIDGYTIKNTNYIDLQILIVNLCIEQINKSLHELRQMKLRERGIDSIQEASEKDFNSL